MARSPCFLVIAQIESARLTFRLGDTLTNISEPKDREADEEGGRELRRVEYQCWRLTVLSASEMKRGMSVRHVGIGEHEVANRCGT